MFSPEAVQNLRVGAVADGSKAMQQWEKINDNQKIPGSAPPHTEPG